MLLVHKQDRIHKAVGWTLREVGKLYMVPDMTFSSGII